MIVVYDVDEKRVSKVCQFLRRFMNWIQNSVFEGELTISELEKVKIGLKDIIDENEDSVIFYILNSQSVIKKEHIGIERSQPNFII